MGTHPKPTGAPDALSTMLREGTAHNHREAERRPFMRVFFKGELPRDAYVAWLGRQWHVYRELEARLAALGDDPKLGAVVVPALHRTARIERDLDFLTGGAWGHGEPPSAATQAYVERIRHCAQDFPPGVVAHAWLRYLGNVGGQPVLRRLVDAAIGPRGRTGMDDPRGLAFTDYSELGEVGPFFGAFHRGLDAIPLSLSDKQRVVAEGDLGFRLNMALTDELAADFDIAAPAGDPDQEYDALVDA